MLLLQIDSLLWLEYYMKWEEAKRGSEMTFTKAQKMFIGIAIIVVIGVSVGGCQQKPEKYTGPVEKITVAAADYLICALFMLLKIRDFLKKTV